MKALKIAVSLLTVASVAMSPALAARDDRMGKPRAEARPNVNKPTTRPEKKKTDVSSKTAYKAGKASSDRNKRDVVVVNPGKNNNGYYDDRHHHNDWDDDDDDDSFIEFVGKTAAVTAGVAAVTAVIGSIVKDKPDECKPVVSGGQQYLLCNGVYYQQVSSGYQVVTPPSS